MLKLLYLAELVIINSKCMASYVNLIMSLSVDISMGSKFIIRFSPDILDEFTKLYATKLISTRFRQTLGPPNFCSLW